MDKVAQIALALIVPIGWGLLSAYLFDRYRAHRQKRAGASRDPEGGAK